MASQQGAFRRPWTWDNGAPSDEEAQRRYYRASCQALLEEVDGGLYWWGARLSPSQGPEDRGFTPIGKSAEDEIGKCFQSE